MSKNNWSLLLSFLGHLQAGTVTVTSVRAIGEEIVVIVALRTATRRIRDTRYWSVLGAAANFGAAFGLECCL